ncbi:MAG: glycosyltransferase [Thermomicrobiales bacterium]
MSRAAVIPSRRLGSAIAFVLAVLQGIALVRVGWRLLATSRGRRIPAAAETADMRETVSVIVPVLDEADRLAPCLDGLRMQGAAVAEILVVDGGSRDGTRAVFDSAVRDDARLRWVDASPSPADWNGKAWNLETGRRHLAPGTRWVLTIDADVRPAPDLVSSLLATASDDGLQAVTVAAPQRLADAGDGLVHPALLATLVLRYGIPGTIPTRPEDVQANGQCFLVSRDALERVGGFAGGRHSVVEDITLGRDLVRAGNRLLFAEPEDAGSLLQVAMYGSWRETWRNWTRSLPMRDASSGPDWCGRMADVTLVQGLPLPVLAIVSICSPLRETASGGPLRTVNTAALMMRIGLLAGMRRAYRHPPPTYWLSPLLDPAVVAKLWAQGLRREYQWRGRAISRH